MVKKLTLNVPRMYADHHTKAVRAVLAELEGTKEVRASSAFKTVTVTYDETTLTNTDIEEHLTSAGYGPADHPTTPKLPDAADDESPWFQFLQRRTWTDLADLEMSGDFRKY